MAGLFASPLVQSLLAWIAKYIFGILSEQWQDYVAHQRVEAHVKETMDKYAELILKYDEKQDAGLITETDKEALRNEKIKLEESLINNIRR